MAIRFDVEAKRRAAAFDVGDRDTAAGFEVCNVRRVPVGDDPYRGEYEVTPKVYEDTVLATKAKTMRDDVRVLKIPQYEVTNESGGMTLILGDELKES